MKGSGDKRTSRFVRLGKVELTPANCKMTTFQLQEVSWYLGEKIERKTRALAFWRMSPWPIAPQNEN